MRQNLAENLFLIDLCWNYEILKSWKASELKKATFFESALAEKLLHKFMLPSSGLNQPFPAE